ncbi:MAG: glycerol-3-phosphate 1-O-acyltransferase PlsY [Tissierellia bacterium]|nr:glycerol-3-phosphate 1-O-acyltransferase PlsY [Tissierellia bacterium]
MQILLIIIISYLIGSISSSYLLGKILVKKDIRDYGSGNAGTTNALRVFGKKIGALTLIFDILKGVIAVYIGGRIMGYDGKIIAGLFAVIGHNWPVFLKFKGGKGIATSFGVLLYLHYPTALVCFIIVLFIIIKTRYMSLGSITAAIIVPIVGYIMNRPFNRNYFLLTLILGILALFRHRSNIKRLIEGKEFKIGEKID